MSLVHCSYHHSPVPLGAILSPQLCRHFSIFNLLTFKVAHRSILVPKRQLQSQLPAWCSHSRSQPADPQHSSALCIWDNSLTVHARHPQHFYHRCTASCNKKTLDSITHRGADCKMHMCQWRTGCVAWAKEKTTEKFRELSEPSWTWATCKGITEFFHWEELLLAQQGIYNLILVL